jgi:hypothetical protein
VAVVGGAVGALAIIGLLAMLWSDHGPGDPPVLKRKHH